MRSSLYALSLLGLAYAHESFPKVLSLPIQRRIIQQQSQLLTKREASTISTSLFNDVTHGVYTISITLGTPGQPVELQLDSGSSDLWVFSDQACIEANCTSGGYNGSASTTAELLLENEFYITYGTPGSYVNGSYFSDVVEFADTKALNVTFGVAAVSNALLHGIVGVGFDRNESWMADPSHTPYPNFIDTLVNDEIINSHTFSLYLDDLESSTGQVIFGGYDTKKFNGDLYILPAQADATLKEVEAYRILLNTISIEVDGKEQFVTPDNTSIQVLMDSGTTITNLPEQWFNEMFQYFQGETQVIDGTAYYLTECDITANTTDTINFGFGLVTIKVPYSEMLIPQTAPPYVYLNNGNIACQFGLTPAEDDRNFILGDTFLRSAYVVFDLDQETVAIAQTIFNTTDSNIVEIGTAGVEGTTVIATVANQYPTAIFSTAAPVTTTLTGRPVYATATTSSTSATGAIPTSGSGFASGAASATASPSSSTNKISSMQKGALFVVSGALSMVISFLF